MKTFGEFKQLNENNTIYSRLKNICEHFLSEEIHISRNLLNRSENIIEIFFKKWEPSVKSYIDSKLSTREVTTQKTDKGFLTALVHYITNLSAKLNSVKNQDLGAKGFTFSRDKLVELITDFNKLATEIKQIMTEIKHSSDRTKEFVGPDIEAFLTKNLIVKI
jgi:methyl-accepting chemotaxis protein